MIYALYAIHILVCLFLILVVLLQQGKGADLSVFGGGGTQTVFGARGAATLLHKLTVGGFVAFIVTTIAIGFMTAGGGGGSSVMGDVAVEEPVTPSDEGVDDGAPSDPEAEVPATPLAGEADGSETTEDETTDDAANDDAPTPEETPDPPSGQ